MAETEIPQDVIALADRFATAGIQDGGVSSGYFSVRETIADAIMADRASRASDRDVLVEALAELVDTLTPAEREPIRDPAYDDEVRALGLRIGFGALMATADYEWRAWLKENGYPLGGEHVAGPCRAVLQSDLRRARAALSAIEAAK